jgi:enterochelin esterase-like enzyme
MSRSGDIWSTTLGPFPPDLYAYGFLVDGRGQGAWSPFEVRSDRPEMYDFRPVRHGVLHVLTYNSKALDTIRRVQVYTPPDYENGTQQLPVLYLLHPAGHFERAWADKGEVPNMMDNLIAEQKIRPMLVVMPFGYPVRALRPGEGNTTRDDPRFEDDLLNEIIPLVERTFRVLRQSEDRAIMGASMGGVQALTFGLAHLDTFRWIASFSGLGGLAAQDEGDDPGFDKFFPALKDPTTVNSRLRLLWLGAGANEKPVVARNAAFSKLLESRQIRHTLVITPDFSHQWQLWRRHLRQVCELLFTSEVPTKR